MPQNNNRREKNFSRYDRMSAEELSQILRLDSEAPEGNGLDIDTLLYITGVLAEREKTDNNTGKTAQEAWISFQQNYMPSEEEDAKPAYKRQILPFRSKCVRRIVAAAAALALMVALPLTAKAVNWEKIWSFVATWAQETFSFMQEGQPDADAPSPSNTMQYESLQQALELTDQDSGVIPTWIPEGFALESLDIRENPLQRYYIALYKNNENTLTITVRSFAEADPERIEFDDTLVEIYTVSGQEYYIFSNSKKISAAWIQGCYECCISGEITIEEIKMMIDSIPKG